MAREKIGPTQILREEKSIRKMVNLIITCLLNNAEAGFDLFVKGNSFFRLVFVLQI